MQHASRALSLLFCTHTANVLLQHCPFVQLETIQNITRNDKESTMKLMRAGGDVNWLDDESNVVRPEQTEQRRKSKGK